ncbi:MAG: outer membrane protein assembly factor [Ectothiorhodospiraceae bacterium]|nr:outer membrane protein assembly factor [Chromatiales bacterium]MCP5157493.1 outer membrane protein assembly factor [Ectothiorhodospiraceae bacterium]
MTERHHIHLPRQTRAGRASVLAVVAMATVLGGCARVRDVLTPGKPEAERSGPPRVEVVARGLDPELEENLRGHLAIAAEPCDAPDWRVERLARRVPDDAARALRAFGYYAPSVRHELARTADCWRLTVDVERGAPVRITEVDVRVEGPAAADPEFTPTLGTLAVREGQVLRHPDYDGAKSKLAGRAAELGYLDARFTRSELRVDPARGEASVHLHLDSGPRYRLGALHVDQDALDSDLVRRIAAWPEGEPYSAERVTAVDRALADSGYFDGVRLRPRLDAPEGDRVPVDLALTPRKQHEFLVGGGVTTDTGPWLRLGYENRRLNRSGHRLQLKLEGSLTERKADAEYQVPLGDPRSEWLGIRAGARQADTDSFDTTAYRLGVRSTHRRGRWLETRFVDLGREDFEIGGQSRLGTFLVPGVSWARTQSDDPVRPLRGFRLSLELSGTSEALASDTSFARARLSAGLVRGVGSAGGRVLARADLGAMWVDDFDRLPPTYRFFAGGDNSLRGHDIDTLGPTDAAGRVVGGRYLAVGSLEYEHPVRERWSVAAFVDAGNAFGADLDGDVEIGVGAGVRWQSPVGPMRVDLAHPVGGEETVRLHLRLGPDL